MKKTKKVKQSIGDRTFDLVVFILAFLALGIAVYPLYFVVIASFSDPDMVSRGFSAKLYFGGIPIYI